MNRNKPPNMENWIEEWARETAQSTFERLRNRGIPAHLVELFKQTQKKDAVRLAKNMTITGTELSSLILNCDSIGFLHSPFHLDIIPEHLYPTEAEEKAFKENGVGAFKTQEAKKFVRKLSAMLDQRKMVHGHLFENQHEWHLLYFTPDDAMATQRGKVPHWVGGNHIHYTSHLWGLDREVIWSSLQNPPYIIKNEHIKYVDSAE